MRRLPNITVSLGCMVATTTLVVRSKVTGCLSLCPQQLGVTRPVGVDSGRDSVSLCSASNHEGGPFRWPRCLLVLDHDVINIDLEVAPDLLMEASEHTMVVCSTNILQTK
jgi:hypothetical protein